MKFFFNGNTWTHFKIIMLYLSIIKSIIYIFAGEYAGFDENELTSKSGGKSLVIQELKNKFHYNKILMVGDGMTDAEACPPADAFIGR